jgi:hypothetical protein
MQGGAMKRPMILAAIFATLLLATPGTAAHADYDPIGSGTTRLKFDPSFLSLLKQHGVAVSALAPARMRTGVAILPVAGGKFEPVRVRGTVDHEGGLRFERGGRKILFRAPQLKTVARRSPWSVKLGGSQLKLTSGAQVAISRQGFGEQVKATSLGLSAKAATRLAKKLDLRGVIKAGQPLGTSSTATQPRTVTLLEGGKAELTLDPGFDAKLKSLFVAVNPIFPAEHPRAFTLPVFGGQVAPSGSEGIVATQGSIEFLQLGGGQVFWAGSSLDLAARAISPEVDVEPAPPYVGKVGPVAIATVGSGPFAADARTRRFALASTTLSLSAASADTFNEVFAKPQEREGVFVAGEPLGTVSLKLEGQ